MDARLAALGGSRIILTMNEHSGIMLDDNTHGYRTLDMHAVHRCLA